MSKSAYINDTLFPIQEGETILNFVRRHFGKDYVPTLCDAPNLDPYGACRVCSVDVALVKMVPQKHRHPVIPLSFRDRLFLQSLSESNDCGKILLNWS